MSTRPSPRIRTVLHLAGAFALIACDPAASASPEDPATAASPDNPEDEVDPANAEHTPADKDEEKDEPEPAPDPEPPAGMALIPAGPFTMGHNPEKRVHHLYEAQREVVLNAFFIDRFEVTVTEYAKCVDAGACSTSLGEGRRCNWKKRESRPDHPMNCTRWEEAVAYCEWAGKRLPTELEWEKAGRGTDGRLYPWGGTEAPFEDPRNELEECKPGYSHPVGCYPEDESPYGVMDLAGNVLEWVAAWPGSVPEGKRVDPAGATQAAWRGGSWAITRKWWGDLSARHPAPQWGAFDEHAPNKRAGMFDRPGFRCVAEVGGE